MPGQFEHECDSKGLWYQDTQQGIPCLVCRPLNAESMWGSEESPFDLAPRWLGAPAEVSVNLGSALSAADTFADKAEGLSRFRAMAVRHTAKQFGTVKVNLLWRHPNQPREWEYSKLGWLRLERL